MRVIIDRKKAEFDLNISWPPNKFEMAKLPDGTWISGECKPRYKNDPDVEEYNVVIGNARTKANAIRKRYLINQLHLTKQAFEKEYNSNLSKDDFIKYFGQKSFERWNKGKISDDTYAKEKGTLKKLKQFVFYSDPQNKNKPIPEEDKELTGVFPFHEFTVEFAADFDKFLEKKFKNEVNGRWNRHKHINTYLNMASGPDKINFTDPYSKFSNNMTEGEWKPLELDQMKSLLVLYLDWRHNPLPVQFRKKAGPGLNKSEVMILRRFLFQCNCALRISDASAGLDRDTFVNGKMSLTPEKTERYGTKINEVPLNDVALMMLEDEMGDNPSHKLFDRFTDQYSNRLLKRIAIEAKLPSDVNLHHHVARYTFASIMDQAGANHTGLMKYMGLKKRETLEKYVKTNNKVIADDIKKMNVMISQTNQPGNSD
jgi:integrase